MEESWAAPIAEMLWQYSMACLDPCWSLRALIFQEEVEACGIYLSLELVMTIRIETCIVHYYSPLCCGFLFKFTAAWCVVWSEIHAGGMLLIDRLQNNVFCICPEQVVLRGRQSRVPPLCLPWLRFELVGPSLLCPRRQQTLWQKCCVPVFWRIPSRPQART